MLAVDDARSGQQRPKIEEYGQSLFVVLHTVELEGTQLHVGKLYGGRVPAVCAHSQDYFRDVYDHLGRIN